MKYIYCQLLALVREEYSLEDILWELRPDKDDVEGYLLNAGLFPEQVFSKEDLEEWAYKHGMGYVASAE